MGLLPNYPQLQFPSFGYDKLIVCQQIQLDMFPPTLFFSLEAWKFRSDGNSSTAPLLNFLEHSFNAIFVMRIKYCAGRRG